MRVHQGWTTHLAPYMFSRLASAFAFLLQAIGTEENPGRAAYTRAMVLGYGYVYVNIDR